MRCTPARITPRQTIIGRNRTRAGHGKCWMRCSSNSAASCLSDLRQHSLALGRYSFRHLSLPNRGYARRVPPRPLLYRVDPAREPDAARAKYLRDALDYMGLLPGTNLTNIAINRIFIGSCTNVRIVDLRAAAAVLAHRVSKVLGLVSPGSSSVRRQAEEEGFDRIFREAGLGRRKPHGPVRVASHADVVGQSVGRTDTPPRNSKTEQRSRADALHPPSLPKPRQTRKSTGSGAGPKASSQAADLK
jgi:hypothetical protein